MIEGYAFTSIAKDITALCEATEQFIAATASGKSALASGHVMAMALWKRKVEDSFDEVRLQVETDEGLPWGKILNASMEFSQLTRQLSNEGDDYPTVDECAANLPVLRQFARAHFNELLACEVAASNA
ncbi:hypothetical protein [Duganella vulcania]|uniref:Uncharacterized protein n=1 Tax=Duganella vulcania TaxID=2692166 RepID=A0A845GHL8_9BURK|nr:hypothetical protein [Duganella vulcania]MYM92806.1 hypothetical protein [Duganella vulcania]